MIPDKISLNPLAKGVVLLLLAVHLVIAAWLIGNGVTHATIIRAYDSVCAQFARQAGEGQPLYGPFTDHTLQLWYTPLSIQIMGYVSRWFNYDIRVMRLVMALLGVLAIVLVGLMTHRLTNDRFLGFAAAALMAGINVNQWFMDLGSNATLAFFTLLGVWLLIRDPDLKWPTVVGAVVCLFAGFWSKQTGLAYLAAGIFFIFARNPRKGLAAAALAAALVGIGCGYYATRPDSIFIRQFLSHGDNPIMWSWFFNPVLFPEYLGRMGIMFVAVVAGLLALPRQFRYWLKPELVFLAAAAVVATLTRLKYGSGPTQQIVFFGLLIVCGVSFLGRFFRERQLSGPLLLTLLGVQAAALYYDFRPLLITAEDDTRFRQILDILATPNMKPYYNGQGYLNTLVGKPAAWTGSKDCWRKGKFDRAFLQPEVRELLNRDPFDLVIIDVPLEDNSFLLYERLNANYKPVREIPASGRMDEPSLRWKKIVFVRNDKLQKPQ